jgi:hypothetical protein
MVVGFAAALGIRLYDLGDLPLDFHPARSLQTMIKARGMFASESADFTPEQTQTAIKQWKNEPTEEPEVIEHLAVWTYQLIGREDLWFPRFYSIVFWLIGGIGLYLLLKKMTGVDGAVVGTWFYLFVPYGISASRAIMPDPLMMALLIWAIWALFCWSEKPGWGRALLAGILLGLTVYVKLTAVFFVAAVFLGVMFNEYGFKGAWRKLQFWCIGALAVLPAAIYNFVGIYLLKFISSNATDNRLIPSMLLNVKSYINWNSMIGVVTGYTAFLLAVVGYFLLSKRKGRVIAFSLLVGYVLFGMIFIYYYTTHDYYHLPLILLVAVGLAGLAQAVLPKIAEIIQPGWLARIVVIAVLLLGTGENIWQVRNDFKRTDYRSQAQLWEKLGAELKGTSSLALTEDYNARLSYWGWYDASYMPQNNELVHRELAGHSGDIMATFSAIANGKEYFLVTMMDDPTMTNGLMDYLKQTYPILDQGNGYIIFDLLKKN